MKTNWDYTERAHTYDDRAEYRKAVSNLLRNNCISSKTIADIELDR